MQRPRKGDPEIAMKQTDFGANSGHLPFPQEQDEVALPPGLHFAGRIGGNQQFTISPQDPLYQQVVSRVPDATSKFTWKQSLNLSGFTDIELWKPAVIEGIGTCLQQYISGMISVGLGAIITKTSIGPVTPAAFGAFANMLLVSLFIYSGGPVSGRSL